VLARSLLAAWGFDCRRPPFIVPIHPFKPIDSQKLLYRSAIGLAWRDIQLVAVE
jgi:hypothetical protein